MRKHLSILAAATAIWAGGCADKPGATTATATGKPYPLDVCIVSGEKLGTMGSPIVFVHEGQEIKLCCKSCRPDFDKEPAKFLTKLASK